MAWYSGITRFFARSSGKAAAGTAKVTAKNAGQAVRMVWDPALGNMVRVSENIARTGGALINNTVKVVTPAANAVAGAARTGWSTIAKMAGASAVAGAFAGVTLTVMSWWSGLSESIANTLGVPESVGSGILLVVLVSVIAVVIYGLFKIIRRR